MQDVQRVAAWVALFAVAIILICSVIAIWMQFPAAESFLTLTQSVLSWPVAAGGLAFGGGQSIIKAFKQSGSPAPTP